jgi:hypothetical protein
MSDTPLWRKGRVILKTRVMADGSIMMFKPFTIKDEHIMRLTDAPGWDVTHVDAVFTEGVPGFLRYAQDIMQYDIPIAVFREHAFIKDMGAFGEQYHVHRKYYKARGLRMVSPKRGDDPEVVAPELPTKIVFGDLVPCTRCRTTGHDPSKKGRCSRCLGVGFTKWETSDAGAASR